MAARDMKVGYARQVRRREGELMMRRMRPLLAVFVVGLMACNEDTVVVVESDTIWHGDIEQYGTVEGRGNAQFDISEATDTICWTS